MEDNDLKEQKNNSLTWIEKDVIAGKCLNNFLKDELSTSPLYGISSKILRRLIIEGINAGIEIKTENTDSI